MPQYFADIKETEFFLLDDEAHHAANVQRHKEGDTILVFDGAGHSMRGLALTCSHTALEMFFCNVVSICRLTRSPFLQNITPNANRGLRPRACPRQVLTADSHEVHFVERNTKRK